ncbi:MAG: hypothetical protein HY735_08885 [Verrucomicrobia bacterium]|nr:hypothetical protein [Verrucomicrobiota bacterium]
MRPIRVPLLGGAQWWVGSWRGRRKITLPGDVGTLLGSCLLLLIARISEGADQHVVRTWQAEDGLPQNSGTAIVQTSDGYLWVGTFNGLVRFNGAQFTSFTIGNTGELPSGDINELYEDRSGRLWIGTSAGLASYEHGRFTHWREPSKLSRAAISGFAETQDGSLIVAAYEGVWRIVGGQASELIVPQAKWPNGFSTTISSDDGTVWVAHDRKIFRLDGGRLQFSAELDEPISLLEVGRKAEVWCGKKGRAVRWKPGRPPEDAGFNIGDVRTVLETRAGDLWIGTADKGVYHWRDGQLTSVTRGDGLASDRILTLAEDREGGVWIGTDNGGFSHVKRAQMITYAQEDGLSAADVLSIAVEPSGRIWLGTFGGSLCVGENGRWHRFSASQLLDEDEIVPALWFGRDGTLWFGRYHRSLCRVRRGQTEPESRSQMNQIRALFEDRAGRLWVGSAKSGLECLRAEETLRWSVTNGLSDSSVTAIAQDAADAIWVGTANGLNRLTESGVERFFAKDGLGASLIHCLFADREGTLWIGTPGAGLTRYQSGRFATVTSRQGLHSDVVAQILEDDDGHFWIGSTTGIFRVGKQALHDVLDGRSPFAQCRIFGRKDGMRSVDCPGGFQPACTKTPDGRLWFCTAGGVTVVDPKQMGGQGLPPPVHIERLLVDGVEFAADTRRGRVLASGIPRDWRSEGVQGPDTESSISKSEFRDLKSLRRETTAEDPALIKIPPGARRMEIQCAALGFASAGQNQYRFWLEGYEDNWQEAGTQRMAHYSQVPPGRYKFHVKAATGDGIWNETEATLALFVLPTWRQTWWYRLLVFLLFLGALAAIYHHRVRELKRSRAQQTAFARQLIDSQEAERKRIAGELHDSLGQSLVVIKNRSKMGSASSATSESARQQLHEISNLSAAAIEEVRSIAQNLRPYQLDRLGLTRALHALLSGVPAPLRVIDEIDPVDRLFPAESEIHLFRIAQEFLNNAIKHAQATEVRFSIRREEREVQFWFADNGRGFETPSGGGGGRRTEGLGLLSISERLRILGTQPEFRSAPAEGTSLRFTLPVRRPSHESAD